MADEEQKAYALEDYLKLERDAQQWIIQDLIPISGLTNLYSSPKCGKTMLTMRMALSVADPSVSSCMGLPILTHGKVLYIQLDTPRNQWAFRLERAITAKPIPPGQLYVIDRLVCPESFTITDPKHRQWLKEQVRKINPVVAWIDTIREAHQLDEDNSGEMKKVVSCIIEAIPHSAVVFLSHSRKAAQGMADEIGNIIDDARGSGYISGRMDSIIRITKKMLAYQTRSGKGEFQIKQIESNGEIVRLFNDKTLNEFIRYNIERNPDFTRELHIRLIMEAADISQELAEKKYDSIKTPKDSPDQYSPPPPTPDLEKALKSLKDLPDE